MSGTDLAAVAMLRQMLWARGWRPLPVYSWDHPDAARAGKAPLGGKWQLGAQKDPPECVALGAVPWAANTGLWMGGLRGVDIDVDDPAKVAAIVALAQQHLGDGFLRRCRANSSRTLLIYRAADPTAKKKVVAGPDRQKVELLGHGQQAVCYGHHPSGAELTWPDGGPLDADLATVTVITEAKADAFLTAVAPVLGAPPYTVKQPAKRTTTAPQAAEPPPEPAQLAAVMQFIPNDGSADWEHWTKVGLALFAATAGSDAGRDLWVAWSARHPDYDADATLARWEHYATSPPDRTGAGKLFSLAAAAIKAPGAGYSGNGGQPPPPPLGGAHGLPDDADAADQPPERPVRFSDSALAFMFTDEHGEDLRYVPEWGTWLRFTRGLWREDPTVAVFDAARALCAREGNIAMAVMPKRGEAIATAINRATTIAAIERLARHHAPHVRRADQFDSDIREVNAMGQIVHFGGRLAVRPVTHSDYFTRSTAVMPTKGECPEWHRFLRRIMADDQPMIAYLHRLCGYCLTGDISEHALFFLYGSGANGKSTLANVLLEILGTGRIGYATVAPMSVFTAQRFDQHPTELAMLQGKRLVIAHETEEGRAWATARIKALTGGDPISARFMRCDFFQFTPQFKLLVLGNTKPALRVTDTAMRRRLHLIPFEVTIPENERDRTLPDKLRAEYPQILAWMIRGAAAWMRDGLAPPRAVLAATGDYFQDEDVFAQWLAECCVLDPDSSETLQVLFASWQSWAEANGEYIGSRRRLAQRLDGAGLSRGQEPKAATRLLLWYGIRVRTGAGGRP